MLLSRHLVLFLASFFDSGSKDSCPKILTKEEWGGRPPAGPPEDLTLPVPFTVIHHGGTPEYCTTFEECSEIVRYYQNYHMDTHGWNDIGYNFVVGEDGNIYEGRGWSSIGAHAPTFNNRSIGICIIGDFTDRIPNEAALDSVKQLISCGVERNIIQDNYKLIGHRQNPASQTVCPGDALYNEITSWPHWANPNSIYTDDILDFK